MKRKTQLPPVRQIAGLTYATCREIALRYPDVTRHYLVRWSDQGKVSTYKVNSAKGRDWGVYYSLDHVVKAAQDAGVIKKEKTTPEYEKLFCQGIRMSLELCKELSSSFAYVGLFSAEQEEAFYVVFRNRHTNEYVVFTENAEKNPALLPLEERMNYVTNLLNRLLFFKKTICADIQRSVA